MGSHIEDFFSGAVAEYQRELQALEQQIRPTHCPGDDAYLSRLCAAHRASINGCRRLEASVNGDAGALKSVQARFRAAIAPWFDQSWFMQRACAKPRGYPGDFEIMEAIYDGVPRSGGLGGYLDLTFLGTTLARGVQARRKALEAFLASEARSRNERLRVLNVGCGPCREFRSAPEWLAGPGVRITCLDHDQAALDWAQAAMSRLPVPAETFTFQRYNALRLAAGRQNVEWLGRFDLIYSVGLCDYLPDATLVRLVRACRELLAPGGVLYLPFKDAGRYDKTEYQWHVDWHFLQRTEDGCRRLLGAAGWDLRSHPLERDQTGVMMIFTLR